MSVLVQRRICRFLLGESKIIIYKGSIKKAVDESTAFLNQLNLTTMNSVANGLAAIRLIKKSILKNVKT